MSFGIFEAATADDLNDNHRRKLATTRLAQAAAEVDHKLGPMLAKSTSVNDYHDRVRLAEKDFREIVGKYLEGDSGFVAVAKKLEPHYTKKRSRRKTSGEYLEPGDLDDNRAQFFLEQFADSEGIDTYGGDYDRIWDDIKESVDYDVISDGLRAAIQSEELGSFVGSRMLWDLEAFNGLGSGARFSSRKTAAPWAEGSEPQFQETPWGEYVMEYGDYSAAVQEDGSWAVVRNDRVVGEGHGTGDPHDSFGEVEQWFKRNASKRPASRRKRSAGPPGFAFDRAKDNFDSDLGGVPGRATNLQGESVEFGDFDSFIDGLTYQWSNVDVGRDEAGQVLVDTWDAHTGYSDQFVVEASRRKKAEGLKPFEHQTSPFGRHHDDETIDEYNAWFGEQTNTVFDHFVTDQIYRGGIGSDPEGAFEDFLDRNYPDIDQGVYETVADYVMDRYASKRPASRRKRANGLVGEYYVDDQTGYAIEVEDYGGSEVGVIYDPNGREIDSIHPGGGYKFDDMHDLMGGFDNFLQDSMDYAEKYRRDFHSRRKRASYDVDGATKIIRAYFPELNHNQAEGNVINHMETLGVDRLEEGDIEFLATEIDKASRAGWMDREHTYSSRRKRANPWKSPDDALGSGYFPGWQTDHNEDGWWQINSPDGSDSLVGEGDGSYTMRMDAETPEEAWAERMNFDEALQESEALHYRKNGSRRRAGQARTAQRRGLRRR